LGNVIIGGNKGGRMILEVRSGLVQGRLEFFDSEGLALDAPPVVRDLFLMVGPSRRFRGWRRRIIPDG
jgi:hypothetical protein